MRRAVLLLSILACLLLLLAQVSAALDSILVPASTPDAAGPQSASDLIFGLMAGLGVILGARLGILVGALGLSRAIRARHNWWIALIIGAGTLVVIGIFVAAFVLLGASRNPFLPFVIVALIPLVTLVYSLSAPGA